MPIRLGSRVATLALRGSARRCLLLIIFRSDKQWLQRICRSSSLLYVPLSHDIVAVRLVPLCTTSLPHHSALPCAPVNCLVRSWSWSCTQLSRNGSKVESHPRRTLCTLTLVPRRAGAPIAAPIKPLRPSRAPSLASPTTSLAISPPTKPPPHCPSLTWTCS